MHHRSLFGFSTATTLWNQWLRHAESRPADTAVVHLVAGEEPCVWTWSALTHTAWTIAHRLRQAGVEPGQVCAVLLRHHRNFYPLYMGIEALGAVPAVLAYPNQRLHPDKFRHGLEGMAAHSGLDWLLTERELEPLVGPLAAAPKSQIRSVLFPLEWPQCAAPQPGDAPKPAADDAGGVFRQPCLLQHSSGTTGLQKAVMLSHHAVLEHVARYGRALDLRPDDCVISWLPLYHDMGLIATFHLPLAFGIPSVFLDPFEWVIDPVMLWDAVTRHRGTLVWLPNFAYHVLADRVHEEDMAGLSLESLRLLVNCSEPVRCESHDKLHARFARYGLKREALAASYAMAETTFAVTQSRPGVETRKLEAARDDLGRGRFRLAAPGEASRWCLSSGRLIEGCDARIVDPFGDDVEDGVVGEIRVRSVSLFDGYRNNPEKTAEVLKNGWYHSGDLGFRWEDEFYVIGRAKDLIIVAGKNLYPEDIEDAVNGVPGVLPGRVIAFGVENPDIGTEQIHVIAETECRDAAETKALQRAVVAAGMQIDVTIAQVHLVPPRWLIKSSAGKPSRSANRQRIMTELLPAR